MNRIFSIALVLALAVPAFAAADEERQLRKPEQDHAVHYFVSADRILDAQALAMDGIVVQHILPGNRYIVLTSDAATLRATAGVQSVEPYAAREKMSREGLRAAASTSPFVTVNVLFHDDATFAAAQAAVDAAGGTIETPLDIAIDHPQRLRVRLAPGAIPLLARDEAVFGVFGRPLRAAPLNDVAANQAHVTPLYSAPYNLDGTGIVLSQFEPEGTSGAGDDAVDTTHPELAGRVTTHNAPKPGRHATHVAGTMIAKGITPAAKGMAPNATLQEYGLNGDTIFDDKKGLGALGVTADNNSWGFVLGWQPEGNADILWVWEGAAEYIGGYDALYSAPYDKLAIDPTVNVLFVHSSGNDGANTPELDTNGRHFHTDVNGKTVTSEIWCYSKNGSGTDCPAVCSAGLSTKGTDDNGNVHVPMCETVKHAVYGPFNTMSFIASEKNILSVGAIDASGQIAFFSSRGPVRDGRVKPDVVALGVAQFSTIPGNSYTNMNGTSMSSPVVTGATALLAQQWKQTFNARPTPQQLKTLFIAGARDQIGPSNLDLPGPDYTYGYGLIDAQASVDLMRADAGSGSHIRTGTIANGASIEIPLAVTTAGKFRAVLGWADPEVVLTPANNNDDPFAEKTLVNDLDLKIIDASGNTVLPYVLNKDNPTAAATRGVNTLDNTEVVEIANAVPGNYRAVITGKVPVNSPQTYVFVTTLAAAGAPAPPCTDALEPNDTPAAASLLVNGQPVQAKICANDTDWFTFTTNRSGSITVTVTTKDTPVTVQLNSPGPTPVSSTTVPANSTGSVTGTIGSGTNQVVAPSQTWLVKITPGGSVTGDSSYTINATFPAPNLGRAPGRRPH
jgi:subtilisin family serine protease